MTPTRLLVNSAVAIAATVSLQNHSVSRTLRLQSSVAKTGRPRRRLPRAPEHGEDALVQHDEPPDADDEQTDVGREQVPGERRRVERRLGDEAPVDRPLVEEGAAEVESAGQVGLRCDDEEREREQDLRVRSRAEDGGAPETTQRAARSRRSASGRRRAALSAQRPARRAGCSS